MKKILLSLTVILSFISYSLSQRMENDDEENTVVAPKVNINTLAASPVPENTQLSTPEIASQNPRPVIRQASEKYKNGEYTGDVTDAYYGNLQIKAVISDGKISDVQFLEYPNDRRTSVEINTQAMPYLKQEAIRSQNARVDIVSGATQTSRAFIESLESALNKAKV